jgi:hypothetical protein
VEKEDRTMTKRERHLILTLQGVTSSEFQNDELEFTDYDVKHLVSTVLSPSQLRKLTSLTQSPYGSTFQSNVNAALKRIAVIEQVAKSKKKK